MAETTTSQPKDFPVIEPGMFYGYAGPICFCVNDGSGDQRRVWTRFVEAYAAAAAALNPADVALGMFHVDLGDNWSALPLGERAGYLRAVAAASREHEAKIEKTSPHVVFCTKSIMTRTALRTVQSFVPWMRRVAAASDGMQGLRHLAKLAPIVERDLEKLIAVYSHLVEKYAPGLRPR